MSSTKQGVYVGILAHESVVNTSLLRMAWDLPIISNDPRFPFWFHLDIADGIRPQEFARNTLCKRFLDFKSPDGTTCDVLLMIDHDMISQGWRSLAVLQTPDYDIAGPVQMMILPASKEHNRKTAQIHTVAMHKDANDEFKSYIAMRPPDEQVTKVDAVGSGCIAIKRHVLEDPRMLLAEGYDPPALWHNVYEPNGNRKRGLDVDFCKRAGDLGYTIKINWQSEIGHHKTVDLNQVETYAKTQFLEGMQHAIQVAQAKSQPGNGENRGSRPERPRNEALARLGLDPAARP